MNLTGPLTVRATAVGGDTALARIAAQIGLLEDADVIDETPMAYKDIDAVMAAQSDLIDVVHTLRQVVCVKG